MRKSKYTNFKSGKWTCTYVGIARTQPKFYKGTRKTSRRPGHQTYYYIFERRTSDDKADKLIRLTCREAARVYSSELTVEKISKARQAKSENRFTKKVSYHFIHENK